jgi:hypothetical protein
VYADQQWVPYAVASNAPNEVFLGRMSHDDEDRNKNHTWSEAAEGVGLRLAAEQMVCPRRGSVRIEGDLHPFQI